MYSCAIHPCVDAFLDAACVTVDGSKEVDLQGVTLPWTTLLKKCLQHLTPPLVPYECYQGLIDISSTSLAHGRHSHTAVTHTRPSLTHGRHSHTAVTHTRPSLTHGRHSHTAVTHTRPSLTHGRHSHTAVTHTRPSLTHGRHSHRIVHSVDDPVFQM